MSVLSTRYAGGYAFVPDERLARRRVGAKGARIANLRREEFQKAGAGTITGGGN
jgi:hypothetical protein